MFSGICRRLRGTWPAHHQTRTGHDATTIGFDNATIDPGTLAKIIRVHDEIFGRSHRRHTRTIGYVCQHRILPPLHPCLAHHLSQHLFGIEVFCGNFLGSLGMFLVVTVDRLNGSWDILERAKRMQSQPGRE